MTVNLRFKNPQGPAEQQMYLWAQDLITELRSGAYLREALNGAAGTGSGVGFLGHGECRLTLAASPDTTLYLVPHNGNALIINGRRHRVRAGFATSITNAGLAANTLYYVYGFSSDAINVSLELSTTTHATSTAAGNEGVEIKSGDETRSLIGMIYTDSLSKFRSEVANATVLNWFQRIDLFCAGVGVSATTTTVTPSWDDITVASDNVFKLLAWGPFLGQQDGAIIGISGQAKNSINNGRTLYEFGFSELGSGAPVSSVMSTTSNAADEWGNASGASTMGLPSEGLFTFALWAAVGAASTGTVAVNSFGQTRG